MTGMVEFHILVALAFVLAFAVGRFFIVPVGVVAWLVYAYLDIRLHPNRPRLEPGIEDWLWFITTVFIALATSAGFVLRVGVRRYTQRRSGELG